MIKVTGEEFLKLLLVMRHEFSHESFATFSCKHQVDCEEVHLHLPGGNLISFTC